MPRKAALLLLAIQCFITIGTEAQGTFRNLDFESAGVGGMPAGAVSAEAALPGWDGYVVSPTLGDQELSFILFNEVPLEGTGVVLYGGPGFESVILDGNYSLQLQTAGRGGGTVAIAQRGQIPVGLNSLLFYAKPFPSLRITFSGENLPFVRLAVRDNYDVFGADISAFAGSIGELRLTAGLYADSPLGDATVDGIRFSTLVIPEPGAALLFLGGFFVISFFLRATRAERNPGIHTL